MKWLNLFHIYQPPHWSRNVIDKVVRESYRPLLSFLRSHPSVHLTLNISGSLTEQLARSRHRSFIHGLRALAARGQIELTGSAMYHAILPLLPKREIIRQIRLNEKTNRRWLGRSFQPRGFFPPEMAYNRTLGSVLSSLGFRWVILDSISHPNLVNHERAYHIRDTNLLTIFRNRYLSDYLAFSAQAKDIARFPSIVRRWNGQTNVLITAMDGENLGHHRPAAKRIWQRLVLRPRVELLTVSDLIQSLDDRETIVPRTAGWSSTAPEIRGGVPFALWKNPSNNLHQLQWRLFALVHRLIHEREQRRRVSPTLRREFDEALSSDWFWWASREPWWDVEIIARAANRFLRVAVLLRPSTTVLNRVQALTQDIATTARAWQATGAAQRHARLFLKNQRTPRYLGGNSVS